MKRKCEDEKDAVRRGVLVRLLLIEWVKSNSSGTQFCRGDFSRNISSIISPLFWASCFWTILIDSWGFTNILKYCDIHSYPVQLVTVLVHLWYLIVCVLHVFVVLKAIDYHIVVTLELNSLLTFLLLFVCLFCFIFFYSLFIYICLSAPLH